MWHSSTSFEPYSQNMLDTHLSALKRRESLLDFRALGRTLAYCPFTSRVNLEDFTRKDSSANKAYELPPNELYAFIQSAQELETQDNKNAFFCIDTLRILLFLEQGAPKQSLLQNPTFEHLEFLSHLRRYTSLPIIHKSAFVSEYEILESALYGADCVLLESSLLSAKELKNLTLFALRLMLMPICSVRDSAEVKKAIFAGAQALYLPSKSYDSLLSLLPQSCVILSHLAPETHGLDVSFGVLRKN
ncbi:hypothetical protein ACRE1U_04685 [Helicobacter himalayensis]|uniref:hypothetical protein n=1 Tax=Helicobacter himalayensis TaxID=1591088 RepID=UPI003D6ED383